jgi:acyl-CoA thioesterase
MLPDLEKIRAFFSADRFATGAGAVIDAVTEDAVHCSMALTPEHLNAGGTAQGGAIFTLADFAFAVHANLPLFGDAPANLTVGQSNSISFLAPPRGARLIARTHLVMRGKRVCVVRVEVSDDTGRTVAEMIGNGLTLERKAGGGA